MKFYKTLVNKIKSCFIVWGAIVVMMYGSWIYNYLCNQCYISITTKVLSSNSVLGEVYSIQHFI